MKKSKTLNRVIALVLVVAALFALNATAFATSVGVGDNPVQLVENATANITVGVQPPADKAANGGDTLLAYKVVAISYNKTSNSLTHTFTPKFTAFQTSPQGTAYNGMTVDQYCKLDEAAYKALLGAFTAYLKSAGSPYTGFDYSAVANDSGVAVFNSVALGQYIIVGAGTSSGAKIYQSVTVEVEPKVKDGNYVLFQNYTAEMKTSQPNITKNITNGTVEDPTITTPQQTGDKHTTHKATASVGDDITYRLDVTVPTYPAGSVNKTFYIGDVLSKGLSLVTPDTTIVVKGWANEGTASGDTLLAKSNQYTVETATDTGTGKTTLYIDFDFDKIASFNHVTVDYVAEINDKAVIGTIEGGNPNNASLIYSTDPFSGANHDKHPGGGPGYGEDKDMEIVYTYCLVIDKYEDGAEGTKLANVSFDVKDAGGTVVDQITTDKNGTAISVGLKAGTYSVVETRAPSGYKMLTGPIEGIVLDSSKSPYSVTKDTTVTQYTYTSTASGAQATLNGQLVWIDAEGKVVTADAAPAGYGPAYVASAVTTVEHVTTINKVDTANGYYKVKVANVKGPSLPSTGGMGTTLFVVIGGVLVLCSAIALITKKRMSKR